MKSSELNKYFFETCGLKYSDITIQYLEKLNHMLDLAFRKYYIYCIENELSCYWTNAIKPLKKEIVFKKGILQHAYFYGQGTYFKKRETVEFCTNNEIHFCFEASARNRVPVEDTFIKWCDWIIVQKSNETELINFMIYRSKWIQENEND